MTDKKKKWYQCQYRTLGVTLIIILILLILGNISTYYINNNHNKKNEKLITEILINASKDKALLPDFIIIENQDSLETNRIKNDSILKKEIIKFIANKYSKPNNEEVFNIKPYLNSTEINDEDKIIKHIEFLNSTVIKAIDDSKSQLDREINKINTWISIWIGVIGFLGIFFPLIINIRSLDDMKGIKDMLVRSKDDINKIDEKIKSNEKSINSLTTKTNNIENIVKSLKLISKLKDIDDKFIIYNKHPNMFVGGILEELNKELTEINLHENEATIKEVLHQISYRLYTISTYSFISKINMETMLEISSEIVDNLENLNEDILKSLLEKLKTLSDSLKKN
ncbi:hypothetical protein [Sphingobacterium cellulitidis]|uniref:hypothetical protein n=1 Tax=Sphingobacterium cellulitidis TaxID=1768011 RepID=UPI003C7EA0EF